MFGYYCNSNVNMDEFAYYVKCKLNPSEFNPKFLPKQPQIATERCFTQFDAPAGYRGVS